MDNTLKNERHDYLYGFELGVMKARQGDLSPGVRHDLELPLIKRGFDDGFKAAVQAWDDLLIGPGVLEERCCEFCGGRGMEVWSEPFDQTTAAVCPECSGEGRKRSSGWGDENR